MKFLNWLEGVPGRVYAFFNDIDGGKPAFMCVVALIGCFALMYAIISPTASYIDRIICGSGGSLIVLYSFYVAEEIGR